MYIKRAKNIFFVISWVIIFNTCCISQYSNLKFGRFTSKEGLSSNLVHAVLQDSRGFIWLGTQDGLNRYDGGKFKIYKKDISDNKSISDGYILSLFEDRDSIIWIGTKSGGLSKYLRTTDEFINYINKPNDPNSLSDNTVECIIEDEHGVLWIGTQKGGLNKFDLKTEKFTSYMNDLNDPNSIGSNSIWNLYIDREKNLWIGTIGGGLDMFDKDNEKFLHYKNKPDDSKGISHNDVRAIYEDHLGNLWIGTNGGGLNKFDRTLEKFTQYRYNENNPDGICSDFICGIHEDENKNLWIACNKNGLSIFEPLKGKFTNYKNETGNIYSICSDVIMSLYKDNSGTLWFPTQEGGVFNYNKKKWMFNHYVSNGNNSNSLSSKNIGAMCEDVNGNIWIATHDKGINVFNKKSSKFTHLMHNPNNPNSISSNRVKKLLCDKKGNIWIVFFDGEIDVYNDNEGKFAHFNFANLNEKSLYAGSIFEDKKEFIWVADWERGVSVFDKEGTKVKSYNYDIKNRNGISSNTILCMMEDNQNNLWFGNLSTGIDKLDRQSDVFKNYKNNPIDENSLGGNYIECIYQDRKGNIWIATYEPSFDEVDRKYSPSGQESEKFMERQTAFGKSLDKFDEKQNKFIHYTEKQGLPNNTIHGILEDKHGNLWLSTNKGISIYYPENDTFKNFNIDDGAQGDGFNQNSFLKCSDGEMFFGGLNGLNCFYPDSITYNNSIPPIAITSFKIFNKEAILEKSITVTDEIEISPDKNFFSFEFAALDYTNSSKNMYAYKLDGIDDDWNYVGNTRTANYTDIASGEYIFRVKGSNNDGIWNENGSSIKLIITPRLHETSWFKISFAIIVLICGIGLIFSQRLKKVKKEKQLQEEFSRKLLASQENERKRIAAELHDSLGQDLIVIKSKALISMKKTDDVSKFREQMNEISELTSSTINDVREISYNLRPYTLDRLGLTKTLQSMAERAANSANINLKGEIQNIDKIFSPDIEINIYRIVQECLTNIIKHSEATEINLCIEKLAKGISISISDNGKGFDVEEHYSNSQGKGFGLRGLPERVRLFSGSFEIYSSPGKGTIIKIFLPFKN